MELMLVTPVLFHIIAILLNVQTTSGGPISSCPGICTCDWDRGKINCSNQGIDKVPDFGQNATLVKHFYFDYNNMSIVSTDTFSRLPNLEELSLKYNSISEIDSGSFLTLQKLQELYLNGNRLLTVKRWTFKDLPALRSLFLNQNKIQNIEEDVFSNLPNLTELQLVDNSISNLRSSSINNVNLLSHIFLRNNSLLAVPTDFLIKTPALKFLLMDNNFISTIDKFAFAGCSRLEQLFLNYNRIGNIHKLAFSIQAHGSTSLNLNLTLLQIAHNKLKTISPAFNFTNKLLHLDISENVFEKVEPFSLSNLSNLRTLNMVKCDNLTRIEPFAFAGLSELRTLFLSNNNRLQYISEQAFLDSKKVDAVFLENNNLTTLSENLLDWENVLTLNIDTNNFVCSCDLLWIQSRIKQHAQTVLCSEGNKTRYIIQLDGETMKCPFKTKTHDDSKSRLMTGLVAASVISCSIILCYVLISFRRKLYAKYIHFKYRRQRDDPLFTVEDPRGKRKMFSDKSMLPNEDTNEDTLM